MIHLIWDDQIQITIASGDVATTDKNFEDIFNMISEDVPSPSEGDPDYVYYKRMKKYYPDLKIVKYIPMKMDDEAVY